MTSRGWRVAAARLLATAGLLAGVTSSAAAAQPPVPPPVPRPQPPAVQPPRRDSVPAPRDSVRPDTLRADSVRAPGDTVGGQRRELVQFAQPDSIMQALLEREGYTRVRYRGDTVRFRARDRILILTGTPSAVQRDEQLIVGRTIQYNDSTQIVVARPDTTGRDSVVLRDPSQGADLIVRSSITYDLAAQGGTIVDFNTMTDAEGQTWVVRGTRGAVRTDTTVSGGRIFYAHRGLVTSCTETEPHYHFAARDIKFVSKSLMVVRPAILYIGDVPVMWLPFIFQDMRSGRRSGLLPPRFGVAELVRNSSNYRRSIDNVGYYFNLGDYADSQLWFDWRSGARSDAADPGFIRFNAETQYNWINRFIRGRLSGSYLAQRGGTRNLSVSWQHEQSFDSRSERRLTTNVNWVQSTTVQRQNQIDPNSVLGTINSQLNFQDRFGPASFSAGGSAKQYPGREQQDLDFPNVNLSTETISLAEWLDWTPSVSLTNTQSFNIDQGVQFGYVYTRRADGTLDSASANPSRRSTALGFETPLKIFNFQWANSFRFNEDVQDFPQTRVVYRDIRDTSTKETRVFNQTYLSSIDWNTSFSLPNFSQGRWNLSPAVSLSNVDAGGFFVRSERTGGRWVRQRKRFSYGVNASPTFYAFPPGFGPVQRFRHSINPVIAYSYSPEADVSDEYLSAIGRTRQGYLGSLTQSRVSLQFSTNLEAKLRGRAAAQGRETAAPADTAVEGRATTGAPTVEGDKVRLLSMNFTSLSYDFVRADSVGKSYFSRSGFTDPTFGYTARSDLLPGLDFRATYSLFLGDPASDTAQFKPLLTDVGVSFTLDQDSPLFNAIGRIFGRRATSRTQGGEPQGAFAPGTGTPRGGDEFFARQARAQQVAGSGARAAQFQGPVGEGWNASVTYSSSRQRPDIRGPTVDIDPTVACRALQTAGSPFAYEQCILQQQTAPPPGTQSQFGQTTAGAPIYRSPPTRNLQLNTSFHITPKWSTTWSTTYDFVRGDFGSNVVNLQRELHDWRAVFAVTQSPNGNFAFNFFVALKAQGDIKFDYNRQTYRDAGVGGTR